MPPTLQDIEQKLDDYLYLPDKGIVKLLFAFTLSCRLPIPPLWLFLASGSSNGKTELLNLLVNADGYYALDDLTGNALLSGMKRYDASSSLLDRVPPRGFIVFKDFTTMLSKHKDELGSIMGKLRVIYDGSYKRDTGGQVEEKKWTGKLSLIAAGTTTIYSKIDDFSDMGPRAVIYFMEDHDDYAVGDFMYDHQKDDRTTKQKELQEMVGQYIKSITVPERWEDLPEISREVWTELNDIAHLASTARSPVERDKFSREKSSTFKHAKEAMGRLFGQLKAAAYGLMLQNPGHQLTASDKKLLFKLGLDSIDPRRRDVLKALTQYSFGGDLDEIADAVGYPKSSATVFVEDLCGFRLVQKERVPYHSGYKTKYRIVDKYRDIIQKFENIQPEERALPASEPEPLPPDPHDLPAPEVAWEQLPDYITN